MISIKNWKRFQHFSNRRPPWIKFYRDVLDDKQWHDLAPTHTKVLVMLWLLASEDEGRLPCVEKIAFRLRMSESLIHSSVLALGHWLDITAGDSVISARYQDDPSERERETETETERERRARFFETVWNAYPRKVGKQDALKAWMKLNGEGPSLETILAAIDKQKHSAQWQKDGDTFIPHLSTWLNAKRWKDEVSLMPVAKPKSMVDLL